MTREVSVSISSSIELAAGQITKADGLAVTLVQPPDTPEAISIICPLKPTVVEPAKLQATVAAIVKILSSAHRDSAGPTTKLLAADADARHAAAHFRPAAAFEFGFEPRSPSVISLAALLIRMGAGRDHAVDGGVSDRSRRYPSDSAVRSAAVTIAALAYPLAMLVAPR
jgi:hypothetical protein